MCSNRRVVSQDFVGAVAYTSLRRSIERLSDVEVPMTPTTASQGETSQGVAVLRGTSLRTAGRLCSASDPRTMLLRSGRATDAARAVTGQRPSASSPRPSTAGPAASGHPGTARPRLTARGPTSHVQPVVSTPWDRVCQLVRRGRPQYREDSRDKSTERRPRCGIVQCTLVCVPEGRRCIE